jgi:septation ring formation regulator EzrA
VLARVKQHLQEGRELLQKVQNTLGEDDPLTDRFSSAMAVYESAFEHMAAFIERSEGIESFEPAAFTKVEIVFEED